MHESQHDASEVRETTDGRDVVAGTFDPNQLAGVGAGERAAAK